MEGIGTYRLDINDSSKLDECEDIVMNAQDQVVIYSTFNEHFVNFNVVLVGSGCVVKSSHLIPRKKW